MSDDAIILGVFSVGPSGGARREIYGQGDRARGYRTRLTQAVALQIRDDPRGSGPSSRVFL